MNVAKNRPARLAVTTAFTMIIAVTAFKSYSENQWYGGSDDVSFAMELWHAMEEANLVGENAKQNLPYFGAHPHGAILESSLDSVTVRGVTNTVATKRSYRGTDVTIDAVQKDRAAFLEDFTVMFKREDGYDTENNNWFWAKYEADGSLSATPNGVKLAGRIAKGKPKGCIACHRRAASNDYLFIK